MTRARMEGEDGPDHDAEGGGHIATRRPDRRSSEAEALYEALLDGLLDPAVTIDELGTIEHVSASVQDVFGYRPDELVGRNIKMLMPEPHRSAHDSYLDNYKRTGVSHILGSTREFQAVHKDGTILEVELSIARVDHEDHDGPLFIGSFRDITERKRAQRTESSMLRALATLGESAAILAHEIKTPVTAVNLALRAVAESLGEDSQQVLSDLVRRMKRLEQQMRQTLSFAKPIDLRYSACDARELFEQVVANQRPVLESAGLEVAIDVAPDTPGFEADVARLEEVVTNLVTNAQEMLAEGGRLRLSASRDEEGDHVCLRVEDDGPGIQPDLTSELFKPFVTSKEQGTGLGLPICRRIVEEHGGTITACDSELGGACFTLRLPVVRQPSAPNAEPPS